MSESAISKSSEVLSDEAVAEYLLDNPEFFVRNESLLKKLKVPHRSGSAISLGERQVQVFREDRDELQSQLNELIAVARENDERFEKSKRLLLNLLEVKNLDEIGMVVKEAFKDDENVHFGNIILFGALSDYPTSETPIVALDDARQTLGSLMDTTSAVCGQFQEKQLQCLFPNDAEKVKSAAVIPLRNGEILGFFCLGSENERHFDSSMGSLFLSYISEFISRLVPELLTRAKRQMHDNEVPSLLE